jgi:colanic acid/amylovoran biosynthesis glycosyltransferase
LPHRIALVVPTFPRVSETFVVSKFLGLLAQGWDVHVVCDRSDAAEWSRFPQLSGVPGVRDRVHVSWPHRPRWKAAVLMPFALLRCLFDAPSKTVAFLVRARRLGLGVFRRLYLDAALIRLRSDLMHFEFGALAVDRMDLGEFLDCPIVVSFRGYDLNYVGLEDPAYYAPVWRGAAALHLLGADLWRRAQRRGCPPEKRHVLIPPAIDVAFFDPAGNARRRDTGPFRILSVGRLEWKKGYEDALVALRALLDQGIDCEYRILGDGEFLGALGFARHQLDIEGRVSLLGAGSRDDVRTEMRAADVFLHAAVSEGFCNAVLEAQAMELPVVCTDADGLPENVENGVTGIVVERRNPKALSDALAELAGDPDLRRRMGEAGRARVASRFRTEDQIEAFGQLYRTVLAGRSGRESLRSATSGASA